MLRLLDWDWAGRLSLGFDLDNKWVAAIAALVTCDSERPFNSCGVASQATGIVSLVAAERGAAGARRGGRGAAGAREFTLRFSWRKIFMKFWRAAARSLLGFLRSTCTTNP